MSELKEKIQNRIKECMKSGNTFERDTLRTVLGESQSKNLNVTDEDIIKTIKKSKQNCLDNMELMLGKNVTDIQNEIEIYDQYLPNVLSVEEIIKMISDLKLINQIIEAKSSGQAVGQIMSFCKRNPISVDGKDVLLAVERIRKTYDVK
jgi:uncharacterized protein YqeY